MVLGPDARPMLFSEPDLSERGPGPHDTKASYIVVISPAGPQRCLWTLSWVTVHRGNMIFQKTSDRVQADTNHLKPQGLLASLSVRRVGARPKQSLDCTCLLSLCNKHHRLGDDRNFFLTSWRLESQIKEQQGRSLPRPPS